MPPRPFVPMTVGPQRVVRMLSTEFSWVARGLAPGYNLGIDLNGTMVNRFRPFPSGKVVSAPCLRPILAEMEDPLTVAMPVTQEGI